MSAEDFSDMDGANLVGKSLTLLPTRGRLMSPWCEFLKPDRFSHAVYLGFFITYEYSASNFGLKISFNIFKIR